MILQDSCKTEIVTKTEKNISLFDIKCIHFQKNVFEKNAKKFVNTTSDIKI